MWSANQADRAILAWMLSPISVDDFCEAYYEKAPLHISRKQPGFYDRYFSLADLESVLFGNELHTYDVNLVKDGTPARPESFVMPKSKKKSAQKDPQSDIIDADRLSALFSGGCSVVLDKVHKFSTKVAELKRAMEMCMRHTVNGNLYLTPPGSQGFAAHYDSHDTIIIQIQGVKHWLVYEPPFDLPLDDQTFKKGVHTPGKVLLEIEMHPGDLLYIPRGFMHEAKANEDLSLHITMGLYPRRVMHVLEDMMSRLSDDPEAAILRRTFTEESIPELLAYLNGAMTAQALREADDRLKEKFETERRNGLGGQISEVMRLRRLSEDSYVALRPNLLYRVTATEKNARVVFSGKTLIFGPGAAAIIHELEGVSQVPVRALLKHDEKALTIVRKLIQEGFAVQVPAAQNPPVEVSVA